MPILIVPANVHPCQIDLPSELREAGVSRPIRRSLDGSGVLREGAIHIRPATRIELSDDEWCVLQQEDPELARRLIAVHVRPVARKAVSAPALAPKAKKEKVTDSEN